MGIFFQMLYALQNDKIEFRGSEIVINGVPFPEKYLKDPSYQISGNEIKSLQVQLQRYGAVPAGSFLALSDNRPGSRDSRTWGFLSTRNIIGKIIKY